MSNGLRLRKLKGNVDILNGFAFPSEMFSTEEGLPLVRIRDLGDHSPETFYCGKYDNRYIVQDGDVLVGMDGDFHVACWRGGTALLNQRVCRIVGINAMDTGFLYHYLQMALDEVHRKTPQTTVRHLSHKNIENIYVPSFSPTEQRRIAEILDTLDLQASMVERAVGKQKTVAAALTATLIPVLPNPVRLDGGWDLVPLSDVVPSADYGISTPLATEALGTPTLRMNNLEGGRIKLHEVKYSTVKVPEKLILREHDVLFNRTNSIDHVGRTAIWCNDIPRATFASYLVRLNVNEKLILPQYLVRWLNHPAIQQRIRRWATPGVHQVNINPTNLRRTYIELPKDLAHQRKIIDALDACELSITRRKSELKRLRLLKQGLMEDLLTGRVRVSEAEAVLEGL